MSGFFSGFGISDAISLAGSVAGVGASIFGANKQADAARDAAALSQGQFDTLRNDLAPNRAAGEQALFALLDNLGLPRSVVANNLAINPETGKPFPTTNAFSFRETPAYQFQMSEGTKAIDRGAAARGSLKSGARLKALQTFGQGLADQTYGDYMNRLAAISGLGQTATTNTGQFGAQNAAAQGQALVGAATANANGLINGVSSFNQGVQNLLERNARGAS